MCLDCVEMNMEIANGRSRNSLQFRRFCLDLQIFIVSPVDVFANVLVVQHPTELRRGAAFIY